MSTLSAVKLFNSASEIDSHSSELSPESAKNWKVIVIDAEKTEHAITNVFLNGITVGGRSVDLIDGYSAKEASALLLEHSDVAVVIVDVVMETKFSGFEVIRYLRETLHNRYARIILRSATKCNSVNLDSIRDYDISAQAEKSEMTADKLREMVTSAIENFSVLRAQRCIKKIRLPLKKNNKPRQLYKLGQHDPSPSQETEQITLGSWEWCVRTNSLKFYSKSTCFADSFSGDTKSAMQDLFNTFSGLNQQIAVTTIESAMQECRSFDFEHYIKGDNGFAQLIRHQGHALIDSVSGELVKMLGVIQNVSGIHKDNSCREKASKAVDPVSAAIVITDCAGIVEYINPICR